MKKNFSRYAVAALLVTVSVIGNAQEAAIAVPSETPKQEIKVEQEVVTTCRRDELQSYFFREATKWRELARKAELGDVSAQFNLGMMYFKGQDIARAYMWISIAAESGHTEAMETIDKIEKEMTWQQIDQAMTMAVKCQKRDYKKCE